jgi:hypothetical protein
MEELLARFPEEFFPRKVLRLKGRQEVFSGVGRFDLLFEDNFQSSILMELKAVTAKLDVAEQLVKYKQALDERGEKNIVMWLVAPLVPKHVADFLDRFGIEHTEIHEAEFRQVASKHGIVFESDTHSSESKDDKMTSKETQSKSGNTGNVATGSPSWSFRNGAQGDGGVDDFISRCDREGKAFYSVLFETQKSHSRKTKVTWDHESGFSLHFCFKRLGFVQMVWGFPIKNREGKPRIQKLAFPFDSALKRGVPENFIGAFGNAINECVAFTGKGLKRPSIEVSALTPAETGKIIQVIFDFAEKAGTLV